MYITPYTLFTLFCVSWIASTCLSILHLPFYVVYKSYCGLTDAAKRCCIS